MKLLLSIIFSFYLVFYATAGRIDSLKSELAKAVHDTVKIKLLNSIGFIMETDYPDSSAEYYRQVYDLALRLKKSKKKEIVETGEMYELLGLKNAGYVLFRQGNIEQAIGKFLTAANIMEALLSQKDDPIKKQAMRKDLGNCYNTIGVFYDDWGIYRQALEYYIKALDIRISLKDSMAIMAQYNNIGIVHKNMGDFGLAIENYQKAVKICGNLAGSSDTSIAIAARSKQASCLNNIGTIYAIQEIFDRAEQYYSEALQIQRLLNNKSGTADCYNNIGILNWQNAKRNSVIAVADSLYDVAIENFVKSMEVFTEIGDKEGISDAYNNLGIVYRNRGSNTKALEYYRKSLEIDKETGDLGGQTLVLANIASLLIFEGRYQESVEYSLRALDLARRTATLPLEKTACVNLAAAYDSLGRKSEALDYYIKYMRLKDSLFNLDKQNLIEEMEGRFQLDKKQLQIDNLNKEKALQQLELEGKENDMKRQRFMIYTFVAGFIVTLVFAALLFRLLREKRKANRLLEKQNAEINEKNEELNQQNEEISAQRDKLEELNEELIKQRKEIGELYEVTLKRKAEVERQKEEITDSINYALRIQTAVLPSDEQVGEILGEHFVFFKPKDIVSGDFYWVTAKIGRDERPFVSTILAVAVADCTGHGVPGAFMSMLGIAFLNEIIRSRITATAGEVLDVLRDNVIIALRQQGITGEQKDGMDISLCFFNRQQGIIEYAGANTPLYIILNNRELSRVGDDIIHHTAVQYTDRSLIEIKADKMPIAHHYKMVPFSTKRISVESGEMIYLFSDGFADQFGGMDSQSGGKKFKYHRFRNLLMENSNESMSFQKNAMENRLNGWMSCAQLNDAGYSSVEQIDDITVIGIRV